MEKILPQIIKDNCFDFWWDNAKVHALDLPIEKIAVKELDWIFDLPFWSNDGVNYCLKPRDFMKSPQNYPTHMARLTACDTTFPIDIMQNPHGKWLILDGLHRLVRLVMEGNTTVRVRKLSRDLTSVIRKEKDYAIN